MRDERENHEGVQIDRATHFDLVGTLRRSRNILKRRMLNNDRLPRLDG